MVRDAALVALVLTGGVGCNGTIGELEGSDSSSTSSTSSVGGTSGSETGAGGAATTSAGGAGTGSGGNGAGGAGGAPGTGGATSGGGGAGGEGSGGSPPGPTGCTADGLALIAEVNAYRMTEGLGPVTASSSMCIVAENHVWDTVNNNPATGQCNLHSWSDQGAWTACCYTSDHAQAQCMWDKPRELSAYTGNGYEISASGVFSPQAAVNAWSNSPGHNDVILNQGSWTTPWNAMGAAISGGVAHVWFGRQTDPMP